MRINNPPRINQPPLPKKKGNLKTGGPPWLMNRLAYPRLINPQCWNPCFYPKFFKKIITLDRNLKTNSPPIPTWGGVITPVLALLPKHIPMDLTIKDRTSLWWPSPPVPCHSQHTARARRRRWRRQCQPCGTRPISMPKKRDPNWSHEKNRATKTYMDTEAISEKTL